MVPLATAISVNIGIIKSRAQRDEYVNPGHREINMIHDQTIKLLYFIGLCFIVVCSGISCTFLFSASVTHTKSYPCTSYGLCKSLSGSCLMQFL